MAKKKNLRLRFPKLQRNHLYEVIWMDAYNNAGWVSKAKQLEDEGCMCWTVGYYIGRNKVGDLIFAGSRDTGDTYGSGQARPEKMIVSIRDIKLGKEVKS